MSTRQPDIRRLESLEAQVRELQDSLRQTADRTAQVGEHRHLFWAETFDDGNYPDEPATVLPIRFTDSTYPLTRGNQPGIFNPQSASTMQLGYSDTYLPPGTRVKVFHQDHRWWIFSEPGQSRVLNATAKATDDFACGTDPVQASDVTFIPWGIFTQPWDEHAPPGGTAPTMNWASGEAIQWAAGDEMQWAENEAAQPWSFANPYKYCGQKDDLLLLLYVGAGSAPIIIDVIRKCKTIDRITFDKESGRTYQETYESCIHFSKEDGDLLWDMIAEPLVTSVNWDEQNCTIEYLTEQFFVIRPAVDPPPDPVKNPVLDFRDIEPPCCPCSGGGGEVTAEVYTGTWTENTGRVPELFLDYRADPPQTDRFDFSRGFPPFQTATRQNSFAYCQTLNVPQGAQITSAKLFYPPDSEDAVNPYDVRIYCADQVQAPEPVDAADCSGRPKTGSSTLWTQLAGTGAQSSPDFSAAVQEVVSRAGWATGNSLLILIISETSGDATLETGSPNGMTLQVRYNVPEP